MAQQIFLVRHGETEWSRSGQHTGRTDIPLTAEGQAQAQGLGRFLRRKALAQFSTFREATATQSSGTGLPVDGSVMPHELSRLALAVRTSPLLRARETCRLAGYASDAVVDEDLREWDYGIYEGRTTLEIRKENPDWSIWLSPIPNGESLEQVAARARQVIARAVEAEPSVALFAHGHILRILAACWIGLPPITGRYLALDTATVSVLGYERQTRVIRHWNVSPPALPT